MSEEELTEEEYTQLMQQQADMQAITGTTLTPSDMAEYTEMLAVDKAFKLDNETGEVKGGNVPRDILLENWAINNKNFVWSNFSEKSDRKRINLMSIDNALADSMYEINYKIARDNPDLYTWAVREKMKIKNNIQQRIHTHSKMLRAVGRDRERKLFGTNTGQFASDNPSGKKKGFLGSLMGGLTGR